MSAATLLYDAPGPRAVVRNRVISAVTLVALVAVVWFVVSRLSAKGELTAAEVGAVHHGGPVADVHLAGRAGHVDRSGVVDRARQPRSGVVLGVGRLSTVAAIRWVAGTVVEFFRAVPVLIMMIFSFWVFAKYNVFPSKQLALAGVVTGLTLYNGAVIAEIVRAGVNALPRGQAEAAAALGLGPMQAMRLVLLPQAITAMLPALVSQLVVVLKDTAIGYQITYLEMVRQGTQIGAQYGNYVPALIVIAVLMIAVNVTLSWLAGRLEARLRRRSRSAAPTGAVRRTAEMDTAGA